jgi:hypothetical protein
VGKIVRGALPQTNVDAPKIQGDLAEIGREESKVKGAFVDRNIRQMESDAAAVHRAQEGIEPVDIRPWDAEKERQKYSTSPIEQFGSFAFIAATLASAFTRQPMTNALNAAGAAMEATNKRDSENYDKAYDAFKLNADLAIKRHNIQHEAYQDAIERLNVDKAVGLSELEMLAAKFGDKRAQALIDGGYIKELIEYQNSQRAAYLGMAQMMPQLEQMNAKRQAAEFLKEQGKNPAEIYHDIYAPAYSNTLGSQQARMIDARAKELMDDGKPQTEAWQQAAQEVTASFNKGRSAQSMPAQKLLDESFEGLKKETGIELPDDLKATVMSVMSDKSAKSNDAKLSFTNAMAEIRSRIERGDPMDSNAAGQIIRDAMTAASSGQSKIDQAIVNQLPHYKDDNGKAMDKRALGYLGPKSQERVMGAQQSVEQIEHIAQYAAENPEAVGLLADAARRVNVDAYKGMLGNYQAYIPKITNDRDTAIDEAAKAKGLSSDMVSKAKVLNKMLATQAFADAAQAGSRGATIYLDKAFREIYQQASSLPAFFDILHIRERDADMNLSRYNLDLKKRDDFNEKFGFYANPEKYLERAVKPKAPPLPSKDKLETGKPYDVPGHGEMIWGGDGFYTNEEWALKNKRSELGVDADAA